MMKFSLLCITLLFGLNLPACAQTPPTVTSSKKEQSASSDKDNEFYPYGNRFPMALYAITDDFRYVSNQGWNIVHNYQAPPTKLSYIKQAQRAKLSVMARMSVTREPNKQFFSAEEDIVKNEIETLGATGAVAWWDLPEEQRYWIKSEMDVLKNYSAWTRKYDPEQRPNLMYIPGHYKVENIQKYVSYVDILPASCYSNYMKSPASYLRWSIERTIKAIENENYKIGKDYLNDEKTVMAILELYSAGIATMSREQSYHDFWLSLAMDVKGILVYSYAYKDKHETLKECWESINTAARRFTGKEQLDKVALEGEIIHDVDFEITSGPQRTRKFTSYDKEEVDYPSLKVLAKKWKDHIYIIAVNSNTSTIQANIKGIPNQGNSGDVLFERRNIKIDSGILSDEFKGYGVHIYKIPLSR